MLTQWSDVKFASFQSYPTLTTLNMHINIIHLVCTHKYSWKSPIFSENLIIIIIISLFIEGLFQSAGRLKALKLMKMPKHALFNRHQMHLTDTIIIIQISLSLSHTHMGGGNQQKPRTEQAWQGYSNPQKPVNLGTLQKSPAIFRILVSIFHSPWFTI